MDSVNELKSALKQKIVNQTRIGKLKYIAIMKIFVKEENVIKIQTVAEVQRNAPEVVVAYRLPNARLTKIASLMTNAMQILRSVFHDRNAQIHQNADQSKSVIRNTEFV